MGLINESKQLFLKQKETLDTFLKTGAISQLRYDKSYGDLVKKMGMESVAEELLGVEKYRHSYPKDLPSPQGGSYYQLVP